MPEVVYVINGLGRGGGERLLLELLARRRATSVVYVLTRSGPLAGEVKMLGVPVRRLSYCGLPLPWQWGRLLLELKNCRVLHTHFFYSDLVGAFFGRILRVPVRISTRHETGFWMATPHRILEAWIYRGFDKVLCVSQAVRSAMISRGVTGANLHVLSPGVHVGGQYSGRIAARPPYIVSVGRLERVKGHDLLVRAMAELVQDPQLGDLRLRIVGGGSEEQRLRKLIADCGIQSRCEVVGEVTPKRVDELLTGAALFVLPSRSEAAPLSLLEAMRHGVPCVAARVDGVPEIVSDGVDGCLVEPENKEALVAAIRSLVLEPERAQRMGDRAASKVRERFDVESYSQRVMELYVTVA